MVRPVCSAIETTSSQGPVDILALTGQENKNKPCDQAAQRQATSDNKLAQRFIRDRLERSCLKVSEWTASLNRAGKEASWWLVVVRPSSLPLLFCLVCSMSAKSDIPSLSRCSHKPVCQPDVQTYRACLALLYTTATSCPQCSVVQMLCSIQQLAWSTYNTPLEERCLGAAVGVSHSSLNPQHATLVCKTALPSRPAP